MRAVPRRSLFFLVCIGLGVAAGGVASARSDPFTNLGHRWTEQENGWRGTWVRRAGSNRFDARWTRGSRAVSATMTISIRGDVVRVTRVQRSSNTRVASTEERCTYTGRLGADQRTVTGTFSCTWADGPFSWQAEID